MGTYILTSGGRYRNRGKYLLPEWGKYVTQGQILTDYGRGRYLRYGQYKDIWTIRPDSPIVSLRVTVCIAAMKKRQEKRTKNQRLRGFRQRTVMHSFFDYTSPTYTSKTYYFSHFKAILPTIPHSFHHSGYDSTYQFRYTKKKRRTMADSIYYIALTETDSKKRKKEEGAFALC